MMLEKSIGRYDVRKVLRFEMRPVGETADALSQFLEEDVERAAALNTVKSVLEAKHLMFVRRVFKGLPDPLPTAAAIRVAFREDPEFEAGRYLFKVAYKTSLNVRMETECRADERDEVYQKMRTVGVRPSRVTSDDPAYLAAQQAKKDALTVDERLKRFDALKAQGLLTDEEYAAQRGKILSEL